MIKYNFRYRGPFEYDKFVLNILQFHNEVRLLNEQLIDNDSAANLLELKQELDDIFVESIQDTDKSFSLQMYYTTLILD